MSHVISSKRSSSSSGGVNLRSRHHQQCWQLMQQVPMCAPMLNHPARTLLLAHRFDGAVKLKAICIIGGGGGTAPNKMRA